MVSYKHHYTNENINKVIISSDIKGLKYYLYVHVRLDNNEPFYVGVGTLSYNGYYYRATCGVKRSLFWKRVANKTKYDVFIISESNNKKEILDKEINYIKVLGKKKYKNGTLVNLTDGGEGLKGYSHIVTQEMRDKIGLANSKRIIKDSTREKLRIALKNRGIINKPKIVNNGN